jgi:hypothetical protein
MSFVGTNLCSTKSLKNIYTSVASKIDCYQQNDIHIYELHLYIIVSVYKYLITENFTEMDLSLCNQQMF